MCGIVGYIGKEEAADVLLDGLRRLEYRGYDSAGMVVLNGKGLDIRRSVGKLVNLETHLKKSPLSGHAGVGHTRWATHGRPSEENAHPHRDATGRVVVVHNGIIENYMALKSGLQSRGVTFESQTDTEVVAHLVGGAISRRQRAGVPLAPLEFVEAVREALSEIKGTFALGIVSADCPDVVIGARRECPLLVGMGDGEYFLASDAPAILARTRNAIFLQDGDLALLSRDGVQLFSIETGRPLERAVTYLPWDPLQAEKAGYRHFMLKEIHEQPRSMEDTLRGRLNIDEIKVHLDTLKLSEDQIRGFRKMTIVACGTSYHAGLLARYFFESWVQAPCDVEIASEFRYRNPLVGPEDLLVAISQSGETADTIAAVRHAKGKGARTLAVTNSVGSTLYRECHGKILTHCGPEIGVASTKAFTAQLGVLYVLALYGALIRGTLPRAEVETIMKNLLHLPRWVGDALKTEAAVSLIAKKYFHSRHFLFLGRNLNYPIALEGALKLKEISYIHAEGYPAGELKHGPIALIDEDMPVVAIATQSRVYDKVMTNLEEVSARGGRVIALATEGDTRITALTSDIIWLPEVPESMAPAVNVVPLQLLAYHIAVLLGCDVDQPRNLAKSVTVE
ncbi:MAG: glutamine--fructose-6-phosphate transaminase (isomerizing) [Elusimicrobia bacterium]|jgi:glucosamine--fructose-6-phosphate aminotransferase (isomerizing)|nr:glutamine--fructose-6-phosphate transaminase (isomerizing) [Elusimicrobiota bacterium]